MNTVLGVNLLERGNPKEFYKGVSCMIKDFTANLLVVMTSLNG